MSESGALSRGETLRRLRAKHAATVERTQVLLREQKQIEQAISRALGESPKTIPEIAAAVGRPAHEVLWFVAAMRKYGLVVEAGMNGDYPLYRQAKGTAA